MGFYPPNAKGEEEAAYYSADPPFKVRDKERILRQFGGDFALPYGFTAVPLLNNDHEEFGILLKNCPYAQKRYYEILLDPAMFAEKHEFIDEVRSLLELSFDLREKELADADLVKLIDLSDIYLYKLFEGETTLDEE